ncbi:hypothetical protein [Mesorhizobium sp. IMUNJ 23232]|uniref:hypothetical protein n=1 Tax=Mesorhizobium sp. IMUNJ 23232 TaxID=3376064 RepID=UPI00378F7A3D
MLPLSRLAVALVITSVALVEAGCARRAASPVPAADLSQGDVSADEKPEPLPPGVKPLTVEQEEMIAQ